MAIIKTTRHSICSPRVFYLRSVEKMSDTSIQEHFTSLLAEAIDDGMCLDKGPPGLGSTEPQPFFK